MDKTDVNESITRVGFCYALVIDQCTWELTAYKVLESCILVHLDKRAGFQNVENKVRS